MNQPKTELMTPIKREQSADDEEDDPASLARRGKSTLRPRSSKHSAKGMLRLQAAAVEETDSRQARSPSPLKRNHAEERMVRSRKRAKLAEAQAAMLTSGHEVEEAEEEDEEEEQEAENGSIQTLLPFADSNHDPRKSELVIEFVDELLPSYEAQEPGDKWTCRFDGCNHSVYGASTDSSRRLIKEHYHSHALQSQAQLDLICQEERPYLPVNNLIKKIREMAAQATKPANCSEKAAPKPIQRRY